MRGDDTNAHANRLFIATDRYKGLLVLMEPRYEASDILTDFDL